MDYFISDLHFHHKNIIGYCNRPFKNVLEMDEAMISNWNAKVGVSDNVFVIGDVALSLIGLDLACRLNGKKRLIIGNHDYPLLPEIKRRKIFETIAYSMVIVSGGQTITLSHFPMYTFIGDYLIYGHVHNNYSDKSFIDMIDLGNALNASAEINGYSPVTLDELIYNNKKVVDLYHK